MIVYIYIIVDIYIYMCTYMHPTVKSAWVMKLPTRPKSHLGIDDVPTKHAGCPLPG